MEVGHFPTVNCDKCMLIPLKLIPDAVTMIAVWHRDFGSDKIQRLWQGNDAVTMTGVRYSDYYEPRYNDNNKLWYRNHDKA